MNFFKTFLATVLGILASLFLVVLFIIIYAATQSGETEPYIRNNSILKIELSGSIPDKAKPSNPFEEAFNPNKKKKASLIGIKNNLEKAAAHDKIKGVWLQMRPMSASWPQLQEVRGYLESFREESGKFVYAYTDDIGFNEKAMYLATAADSIFAPPETFFEFDGFYLQSSFVTGLYDKLGLEARVAKSGKYKGAIEPITREEFSEPNEYQLRQIVEEITNTFMATITEKTGLTRSEIDELLNDSPRFEIGFASQYGFVDSLLYENELRDHINLRIGKDKGDELEIVSHSRYAKVNRSTAGLDEGNESNKIAVIHASGTILPVEPSTFPPGSQEFITATKINDILEDISEEENIKGIVFRVNSPGGAGTTSDLIWNMIREKTPDVPVIASMGATAASGGYYIAMAADTIVAESSTITGSIGVFARQVSMEELFNDKLGITFDEVKSHEHADWKTTTRTWNDDEMETIQHFVDQFYDTFLKRVSLSRDLEYDYVHEHAQGRVWTGADAQENKLVDVIGGFDDSIKLTAEKAGLSEGDYVVEHYPKTQSFVEKIVASAQQQAAVMVTSLFGLDWKTQEMEQLQRIFKRQKNFQNQLLLWPYDIVVE